jgi:hypothetical protein
MARIAFAPGFRTLAALAVAAVSMFALPGPALADDPVYTSEFHRELCTFTASGSNPYFPLWVGHAVLLEGEEEDDGEIVEVSLLITVLDVTELVDGVVTRVVEERESIDGELYEVSRNFFATCRETGDVWYFGENVDFYEDGQIVDHHGSWRAGIDGAQPGIQMPSVPPHWRTVLPGARARGGARLRRDRERDRSAQRACRQLHQRAESPGGVGHRNRERRREVVLRGIGLAKDELELIEVTEPDCQPDATTLCLNDGRFKVEAEWEDFAGHVGAAYAAQGSDDSGEFWFFGPDNVELLVKVIDGCGSSLDAYCGVRRRPDQRRRRADDDRHAADVPSKV